MTYLEYPLHTRTEVAAPPLRPAIATRFYDPL